MKFTLPIPTGINALYKSGYNRKTGKIHWYKSSSAQSWQEEALWELKKQSKGQDKPKGDSLYIIWFRKDKKVYDIDSGLKLAIDTLVKARVIQDDRSITFLQVEKQKGSKNYCEIEIL